MTNAAVLALAMALDALLGEPRWLWERLPHPAVLMGRAVGWCDRRFNSGNGRKLKGVLVMAGLGLGALLLGTLFRELGWLIEVIVVAGAAFGVSAATESTTTISTAPERTSISVISNACSPVSG